MPQTESAAHLEATRTPVGRRFGRFELHQLLGRSQRTMAWRATDPHSGAQVALVLPRLQPADAAALVHWQQRARAAARLDHPNLARAEEIGVHERWPFIVYDPRDALTLTARSAHGVLAAREVAEIMLRAAQGLAYAHEAGAAHGDLQPYLLLCADSGALRVMGLEIALDTVLPSTGTTGISTKAQPAALSEADRLNAQRQAARRDVLTLGLVMHGALAGRPAAEEADTGRVVSLMPPAGREIVRLPWSVPRPVPDALRAISNRATERQARQRYRSARTLAGALEGWLRVDADSDLGALALLADRLHSIGVLPAAPGAAERAARLALMDRQHTAELAEVVVQDPALALEVLRIVNTAQVRGAQVTGSGPVLTVRRAIAMIGLDGVRRAALALRSWPGPLAEGPAQELARLVARVKRASHVAQALRPAGYDPEVVYLVTLMQNLGRLVLQYHFADEAHQIRRLMQTEAAVDGSDHDEPGMSEEAAAYAVLGVDTEALGAAVARHWGLDDSVLHMIRRLPLSTAVRDPDTDDDMLRVVASCANEAVDAATRAQPDGARALDALAKRYARVLNITLKDLQAAMQPGAAARTEEPPTLATQTPTEGPPP